MVAQRIQVGVKNFTGDRSAQIGLRKDRTIAQVMPRILDRLVMPLEDDSGESITYTPFLDSHENKPYLRDEQFVGRVLVDGDTVCVVPDIRAGV